MVLNKMNEELNIDLKFKVDGTDYVIFCYFSHYEMFQLWD